MIRRDIFLKSLRRASAISAVDWLIGSKVLSISHGDELRSLISRKKDLPQKLLMKGTALTWLIQSLPITGNLGFTREPIPKLHAGMRHATKSKGELENKAPAMNPIGGSQQNLPHGPSSRSFYSLPYKGGFTAGREISYPTKKYSPLLISKTLQWKDSWGWNIQRRFPDFYYWNNSVSPRPGQVVVLFLHTHITHPCVIKTQNNWKRRLAVARVSEIIEKILCFFTKKYSLAKLLKKQALPTSSFICTLPHTSSVFIDNSEKRETTPRKNKTIKHHVGRINKALLLIPPNQNQCWCQSICQNTKGWTQVCHSCPWVDRHR